MNARLVALGAIVAIAGARGARELAKAERDEQGLDVPFAPSAAGAPFVSLGYRELLADLLMFRLVGYFGGPEHTAEGVAGLVEAIAAADPQYQKIYTWGARAMVAARKGQHTSIGLRAVRLLEEGARRFPEDYKIPKLAGEIYLFDLETQDPAQRRAWDERAAQLLETAVRKPSAPAEAATLVAHLQSKLGQRQRAIDGLREMMLITNDEAARARLLEKLGELAEQDAAEIAAELLEARKRFERAWIRERPAVPASFYVLLGPAERPGFDLGDLATGGRDLISTDTFERLEPLVD